VDPALPLDAPTSGSDGRGVPGGLAPGGGRAAPRATTLVLGLGSLGSTVLARIEEAALPQLACLDLGSSDGSEAAACADAARVMVGARELLDHRAVMAKSAEHKGPTELVVVLVGSLGEAEVRARCLPLLAALEASLFDTLGPIFGGARAGRHLALLPMLVLPRAGDASESEAVEAARALLRQARRGAPEREAIARVLLIEDVGERSILGQGELIAVLRNAVLFLGEMRAHPETAAFADPLVRFEPGSPPLGTLACATAELPRARLGSWARAHVGVELLDAVLEAKPPEATADRADAIESIDLDALDRGEDALHVVRESLLDRYLPKVEPDAPPRFFEGSQLLRERWGPDHGDASSGMATPPPDVPLGFALRWTRTIEEAWVRFQRTRFDDLVATERARLEKARTAITERARARIDRDLVEGLSADALRRAQSTTEQLRRAVGERLETAVRDRDEMRPVGSPSFEPFLAAHAELMDALRARPDLDRTVLFGLLAWSALLLVGPPLLAALADGMGLSPEDGLSWWLRENGLVTTAVGGALGIAGWLGAALHRAHAASVAAHEKMWKELDATIEGLEQRSVLGYFASRLRLSREAARAEALLSVRGALDRDRERLLLADRAAKRTRGELRARALVSSTDKSQSGGPRESRSLERHEDIASAAERALFGQGETLITPLVGRGAGQTIARLLPPPQRDTRIADVLRRLAANEQWSTRWREEIPFASALALERATAPHAEAVAEWDPLGSAEAAEATFDAIAAFVRTHAETLRAPLSSRASPRAQRPFGEGSAFLPPEALAAVRARLSVTGAAGRSVPCSAGPSRDRAYYVVAVLDLSEGDLSAFDRPAFDPQGPRP
jgi:hypothetical protein